MVINPVPASPTIASPTITQPTCAVPTGIIVVNATGGGTLEYSVAGGGTYQPSAIFSGLAPGSYDIVARLVSNPTCSAAYIGNPVVLPEIGALQIDSVVPTQPTCAELTGSIHVFATGAGPMEYSVDGGVTYQASPLFEGLPAGIYNRLVSAGSSKGQKGSFLPTLCLF